MNNTTYKKQCPICKKDMIYSEKRNLNQSIKNDLKCKSCSDIKYNLFPPFKKTCPICRCDIIYKQKSHLINSIKTNICCNKCKYNKLKGKKTQYISNCIICGKDKMCRKFNFTPTHTCKSCNFIKKSIKMHENKYDYSKVNYKKNNEKVKIICPLHGEFLQTPNRHVIGQGCIKCTSIIPHTNESFIKKCHEIHGDTYNYLNVNYVNAKTKVSISCKIHGEFLQTPNSHLSKHGCPKCIKRISKSEIEFLNYLDIKTRQYKIHKKQVDGVDLETKTIYEFLGDYWHGNPKIYKNSDVNVLCKKTFGDLYKETFNRLNYLKSIGYNVKYIWESDWLSFKINNLLELSSL